MFEKKELINMLWLALSFLLLFGIAELIYYVFKPKAEYTRKLVHTGTGFLTLLFPVFLHSLWSVFFLCASFAILLNLSMRFHFLRSINAIDRKSHGSISYPLAVFSVFAFYFFMQNESGEKNLLNFYLPILMLALCDPLAALFGKKWPYKKFRVGEGTKSWTGVAVFFVTAFVLCAVLFNFFVPCLPLMLVMACALVFAGAGACSEAVSPLGLDNIFIPAGQMACLFLAERFLF